MSWARSTCLREPRLGVASRRRGVAIAAGTRAHRRSRNRLRLSTEAPSVGAGCANRRHPQIVKLAAEDKGVEAFRLIEEAEKYAPGDPDLARAVASATRVATVHSTPPGALVEVEDYLSPASPWLRLGTTPLDKIRVPAGYLRWRVSKPGVGELMSAPVAGDTMDFDLETAAKAPEGMVPVSGGPWIDSLAFLGWVGPYALAAVLHRSVRSHQPPVPGLRRQRWLHDSRLLEAAVRARRTRALVESRRWICSATRRDVLGRRRGRAATTPRGRPTIRYPASAGSRPRPTRSSWARACR